MAAARLEVRLDPERQRKLAEIAETRGASISALVREWIDDDYEEIARAHRLRLVHELAQLQLEDVPDPGTLARQLESTYEIEDSPIANPH